MRPLGLLNTNTMQNNTQNKFQIHKLCGACAPNNFIRVSNNWLIGDLFHDLNGRFPQFEEEFYTYQDKCGHLL